MDMNNGSGETEERTPTLRYRTQNVAMCHHFVMRASVIFAENAGDFSLIGVNLKPGKQGNDALVV
jgi:hypothetical protein